MTTLMLVALLASGQGSGPSPSNAELAEQVRRTETAFAKTMADRDHTAFASFLADETVFFGNTRILRGKEAVAQAWKALYEGPRPPFSWQPEQAEVLASGTLGFTSGPVFDAGGKRIGSFNSVWRREADGRWKIVFDKGCPPCDCGTRSGATPAPSPSPSPRSN